MAHERHPVPAWVVVGAGTGGTSATIGRFVRYRGLSTQVAVVDPENSAFLMAFQERPTDGARGSRIEGIGRPRVEPSFMPRVVDRMIGVPDAASIAAMRYLQTRTGIRAGGSTGTNLYGSLRIACELRAAGQAGSIVTLMCDPRRAVRAHVRRRRLAGGAGARPRPVPRGPRPRVDDRGVDRLSRPVARAAVSRPTPR